MTIDRGELSLFPGDSIRETTEEHLSTLLSNSQLRQPNGHVSPTVDLDKFRDDLARKTFSQPEDINKLLDWTVGNMRTGRWQ